MIELKYGRRRSDVSAKRQSQSQTAHECRRCKNRLQLVRRHTSPPRLGPPATIEFYRCDACDFEYALNPSTGQWRPWTLP